MPPVKDPVVAIVDHGLGNLFSVRAACAKVGLDAVVTADRDEINTADAVVLPGVGAFGDAMDALRSLDLLGTLLDLVEAGRPLVGLCLGQQLVLTESEEFGRHDGLGLVAGRAVRFRDGMHEPDGRALKVPQIGWNQLWPTAAGAAGDHDPDAWAGTPLEGLRPGDHVYFVHSYHVELEDPGVALAWTTYGDVTYPSAITAGPVVAFQFHPERSGPAGLRIYENLARRLRGQVEATT